MDEDQILTDISAMVEEERELREARAAGKIDGTTEHERLTELERRLDQFWDLLRRRRAASEFGVDPDTESARPVSQVENYRQ